MIRRYLAPHFYKNSADKWVPIDTTLVKAADASGSTWRSKANSWQVSFAAVNDPNGAEQIDLGAAHVAMTPLDTATATATATASGSTATYASLWPDTDLVERANATGIDESLVLSSAQAPNTFDFKLTGADASTNAAGGLDITAKGRTVGTVPSVTVSRADAADAKSVLKASAAQMTYRNGTISLSVSRTWLASLPASAFPVVIDPSFIPSGYQYPTTIKGFASDGTSVTNSVAFGSDAHGTWDGAVSIPVPAAPTTKPNGQPWHLGYANLEVACPTSSCPFSSPLAWNVGTQPTTYAAARTGSVVPATFIAPNMFAEIGDSTWTNGSSPWIGLAATSSSKVVIPSTDLYYNYYYYELPPPGAVTAPANGSVIATTTPTLTTTVTEAANICTSFSDTSNCDYPYDVFYDFTINTAEDGKSGQTVADSGWLTQPYTQDANGNFTLSTPTWRVPTGSLIDGVRYYASVQISNHADALYPNDAKDGFIYIAPPSGAVSSFTVKLRLSAGGPSPTDSVGATPGQTSIPAAGAPSPGTAPSSETVNMVTGDLSIAVGTPQMTTVAGNAGVILSYNSLQSSTSGAAASGAASYGLQGAYFRDTGTHTFTTANQVGTRLDPTVSLHGGYGTAPIGGLAPDVGTTGNGYDVRWTGQLTLPNVSSTIPSDTVFKLGGVTTGGMRVIANGTTVYDNWSGTTTASGTAGFSTTTFTPGSTVQLEVDDWDANSTAATTAQFWIYENHPAEVTHAEYVAPSSWLIAGATGLPPGWSLQNSAVLWTNLTDLGNQVVLHSLNGATTTFTSTGHGMYTPQPGDHDSLTAAGGTLQLSTTTGMTYVFNADGSLASATSAADDRHPAALQYSYGPATSAVGSPAVLQSITDPVSGRVIHLYYGGQSSCPSGNSAPTGMLCQISYWDGTTAGFLYNSNHQLAEVINPGSSTTLFGYDTVDRLIDIRDALANDYIAAGLDGSSACTAGVAGTSCPFDTVITYDSAGRVSTVTQPEPTNGAAHPQRTYTYQPSTSDPGAGTSYVAIAGFSPAGHANIPAGKASSVTYDDQSRITTQTSSDGLSTYTVWDQLDRPLISVSADGQQTSTVFDANSNTTDTFGPAPVACFDAATVPTGVTVHAPVVGYRPVADPTHTTGCNTTVPHTATGYDQGITGLAASYWPNSQFAGAATLHGTGVGISNTSGAACTGSTTGTSSDSLCASWPAGTAPGGTDPQGGWSMKLTGTLSVATTGTYQFVGTDSQPLTLAIDGTPVGTNQTYNTAGAPQTVNAQFSSNISLTAGTHAIELDVTGSTGTSTAYTLSDALGSATPAPVPLAATDPNYGLKTTVTDPDGKITTSGYSAANGIDPMYGLTTATTLGTGSTALTTATGYETPGAGTYLRRTSTTLPAGNQTTYTYWAGTDTLPSSICGVPAGTAQAGLLKSQTDPAPSTGATGRMQYFIYDATGHQAGRWEGPSATAFSSIASTDWQCTTRDSRGRLLTQTWPAFASAPARTVTYTYSVNNNPLWTSVTDTAAQGDTVQSLVDLLGRTSAYEDSYALVTQYSYNQAGQRIESSGTDRDVASTYDPNSGNLATVSYGGSVLATAAYSTATDQPTGVTYSNGTTASLGYDANDRNTSLTFTRNNDSSLVTGDQAVYSPAGRITSELENINGTLANPNPAGAGATDYQYDAAGRLTQAYLPNGVANYSYDANPASAGCTIAPNAGLNTDRSSVTLTDSTGASTRTDYCYNDADQLTNSTKHSGITLVGATQGAQDPAPLTNPDGVLNVPTGTTAGDQIVLAVTTAATETITLPAGYTLVGSYQTNSLVGANVQLNVYTHTVSAGDANTVDIAFSGASARTANLLVYRGVDTTNPVEAHSGATASSVATITAPSITTITPGDQIVLADAEAGQSAPTWTGPTGITGQSSDTISSVSSAIGDATQPTPGSTGDKTSTLSATAALATALLALKPATQTNTTSYDSRGNQTRDGSTILTYDAADRLASSTTGDGVTTSYLYDALDRVIARTTSGSTTAFGYVDFNDVAAYTNDSTLHVLVPLPANVTATITPGGGTAVPTWAYADLHGNTTVTTDNTGTRLGHIINYDPWGQPLADPVDAANATTTSNFTRNATSGKITDNTSGITIMGARAYIAAEGRFATVDPIEGGCANSYVYAFGDPTNHPDLTGKSACDGAGKGCEWLTGAQKICNDKPISGKQLATVLIMAVGIATTVGAVVSTLGLGAMAAGALDTALAEEGWGGMWAITEWVGHAPIAVAGYGITTTSAGIVITTAAGQALVRPAQDSPCGSGTIEV